MSRVVEQFERAGQYLAGGASASTGRSAIPCCSTAPRAAASGTSTAKSIWTSVAATARRCWVTATRACGGRMPRFISSAIRHGVYFHDYGGAACHHGFCAAMTLADVDEALNRLDGAVSRMEPLGPQFLMRGHGDDSAYQNPAGATLLH